MSGLEILNNSEQPNDVAAEAGGVAELLVRLHSRNGVGVERGAPCTFGVSTSKPREALVQVRCYNGAVGVAVARGGDGSSPLSHRLRRRTRECFVCTRCHRA